MKNEKLVSNLCCVAACIVVWIVVVGVMAALHMRGFNAIAGIVLIFLWIVACRVTKKAVHEHYNKNNA